MDRMKPNVLVVDDDVETCHQAHAHIAQIPYKGIGSKAADKEHDQSENFIGGLGEPVVTEEIGHVGTGVKQNADKGGKAEQP